MRLGCKHSEKSKKLIRKAIMGRPRSPETRAKIKATLARQWGLIKKLEKEGAAAA